MKTNIILIFFICLTSCKNKDIKKGSIDQSFKENLFFSKTDSSIKNSSTIELTNNFILNKDEFLKAQFTLDKPLVESIKILAPELTTDQLLEKGNFQFSFLVDGELIYIENLQKGAGLKDSKTKQLQHNIPLISPNQLDFWGWFMWLKFMKIGGGQDALDEGNHTLTIEVRPYIKQETLKIGEILAKGSLQINVPEIIVDKNLIPLQTIKPNSGWEISTDNFDTNKIEALNKKIAQKRFEDINGIVVIKNNKLLIEEYFNGENRETLHNPRSVGKTITSTIMGIAIEENYITSENAKLKDFYDLKSFKNYSTKKDDVTLKSLLTMSSGFLGDDNDYNNPGNEENMYPTKDWVKFALDLPMEKEIGKEFSYFTAGVVVLGDILHKSVPKGLVSYADKKLFSPLNITKYQWEYTPQKVGNTAGGLRLNALDFAKYGQLYKNKGLWNGKQILSKDWVKKSSTPFNNNIDIKIPGEDSGKNGYGYTWWTSTFSHHGKTINMFRAGGWGGQEIMVFPELDMVVVFTGGNYAKKTKLFKIVEDYILKSIK